MIELTTIIFTHLTEKCVKNSHLAPPAAELLRGTLEKVARYAPELTEQRVVVMYDSCPDEREYRRNLEEMTEHYGVELQVNFHQSYQKQLIDALERVVETPYVFLLEHDWWFAQAIAPQQLLAEFEQCPAMQYLRLWNYHDQQERWGGKTNSVNQHDHLCRRDPCVSDQTIWRDTKWSTNPHFARTSKYIQEWIPRLKQYGERHNHINGNAGGIEEALAHDCMVDWLKMKPEEAQAKWGLYLKRATGPIVEHMAV